ncbi:alpha-L-rhamnosidase [Prevotella sp. 10(H)]|uniref:alpha-L-rhamnosidase n=1 Tax=Prevotella sp. 10(H) TaxID=1158294 RepID=UPI0004A76C10|nr:alpha-L-rhamnosidase [Prevotella sp. 10(H)]
MKKLIFIFTSVFLTCFSPYAFPGIGIKSMRTEMRTNPDGIDIQSPRFMWQIISDKSDVSQTAYQIIVAESQKDLNKQTNLSWNSGKVTSGSSIFIPYEGKPLQSRKTYYWKVKVWTNKGESPWSEVANWTMALSKEDWQAKWIGLDKSINEGDKLEGETRLAARYLRKEFQLPAQIRKAKVYITGLGFYECYVNGQRVGKDVFAPTATDYTKHVNYNVYDVTDLLSNGVNTVGVILGNGRYFSMRNTGVRHFGFPKMLMQLEVEDQYGKITTIASDDTWKLTTNGPIIANNEFDGEEYNANLELTGWSEKGYNDSSWLPASIVDEPGGELIAQRNPNIQVMKELKPLSVKKTSRGTYMVDMGQNMVGWLAVNLKGAKNKPIKMVFAESLKDDGSLYMANLRSARVTDIYTPAKDGNFTWEPRFTYHGFRFAEITGLNYEPALSDFKGKVIYDEMKDVGTFESSDPTLNQIYHNAYWGIIGNYRSMPTDCPQRDERMGWLGDRAMGCFGESFMLDNALLYQKWVQDIEDAQNAAGNVPCVAPTYWEVRDENVTWPSAYIFAANMLYEQYGDTRPIMTHYASMKKWMEYTIANFMTDYIVTKDRFGDWCMPPERQELIHSEDPARKTDGAILSTTFFYRLLQVMSKFAVINNNLSDQKEFDDLALKMKNAYNEKYLNKETGQYGNNTVTANILSLMLGLTPPEYQDKVFSNVIEKTEGEFKSHVSTGLVGIGYLMRGLTEYGRSDLAYTIATNRTYPSWGYMIENGATTIWELWNGNTADPAMNSHNHVMLLGDLLIWYYESLAGISTDKDMIGFKKINMKPIFPEKLDYVKASYESVYGKIRSEWKKGSNTINWEIEIPANTTAEVMLPKGMTLDKKKNTGITDKKGIDGTTSYILTSGKHTLTIKY